MLQATCTYRLHTCTCIVHVLLCKHFHISYLGFEVDDVRAVLGEVAELLAGCFLGVLFVSLSLLASGRMAGGRLECCENIRTYMYM